MKIGNDRGFEITLSPILFYISSRRPGVPSQIVIDSSTIGLLICSLRNYIYYNVINKARLSRQLDSKLKRTILQTLLRLGKTMKLIPTYSSILLCSQLVSRARHINILRTIISGNKEDRDERKFRIELYVQLFVIPGIFVVKRNGNLLWIKLRLHFRRFSKTKTIVSPLGE